MSIPSILFSKKEYILMKDDQNNFYYRDLFGKMILPGEFKPDRRPVSKGNAEFYYNQAMELIRFPEKLPKIRAIKYWKSILLLPDKGNVHHWRIKAAQALGHYRKAWGDTFTTLESRIPFLRTELKKEKEFFLHIPGAFLTCKYPVRWRHIEFRRQREKRTVLEGVLLGNRYAPMVQVIIAYDRFMHHATIDVEAYRNVWYGRMQFKKYKRREIAPLIQGSLANKFEYIIPAKIKKYSLPVRSIDRETGQERFSFKKYIDKKVFIGEEHFIRKKNIGYYIAFMAQRQNFEVERKRFYKLMNSIRIHP